VTEGDAERGAVTEGEAEGVGRKEFLEEREVSDV
jgi:hypothetical protein